MASARPRSYGFSSLRLLSEPSLAGKVSPDTKSFPKVQGIGAVHLLFRKASLGLSWLEPSHQSWMWQHGWVWRCCCTCPHQYSPFTPGAALALTLSQDLPN